jgi:hypothetical protein
MSNEKSEETSSGYYYEGNEISLTPRRGRPLKASHHATDWFPQQTKVDACTLYCVYGDTDEVSKLTNVPVKYIRQWKEEPWWNEIQKKVFTEQNEKLASRINSVLDNSLTHIVDRLDNGDYLWDVRKSKLVRKPIDTKVLSNLFNTLVHRRQLIRGEPTNITSQVAVDDRLRLLAQQFEKFANAKEVTQLQPQGEANGYTNEKSTNEETNEKDANEKG